MKRNVDILLASGSEVALRPVLANSATIPIVMIAIDPPARGYVTELARPTGNAIGVILQPTEVTEKRL